MGIKSNVDLSGTVVNGVTLGIPAITELGEFHWDGGVPEGEVTDFGIFTVGDPETPDRPVTEIGVVKFPVWKQPTGAHDVYAEKTVVEDEGELWVSTTPNNPHKPGVSGWRRFSENPNVIQPWLQPTGAHDAYAIGDEVTHNAVAFPQYSVYRSKINANTTEPGTDGTFHRWWEPIS